MTTLIIVLIWSLPYLFQLFRERNMDDKYKMNGAQPLLMILIGWFLCILYGLRVLDSYLRKKAAIKNKNKV